MDNLAQAIDQVKRVGIKVKNNKMLCPFHTEKTPSACLWINPHHNQIEFHCFGCGKSYKFETFYRIITNGEYKQKELRKQVSYIDLNLLSSWLNAQFVNLLEDEEFKQRYSEEASFAEKAKQYLKGRGLDTQATKRYGIGFVMRGQVEKLEGIRDNAWVRDRQRYCFLVFPVRDQQGKVVTMQFEDFLNKDKLNLTARERSLWFSQTPNQESKDNEKWGICEGIYDAISFDLAGLKAIALLGQPSCKQKEDLKKFNYLILALDNDEGGRATKKELAKELYPKTLALREVVYPQESKDPNELLQKESIEGIRGIIERAKEIELFPPLINVIDGMIEQHKRIEAKKIKLPSEFEFLNTAFGGGITPGLYGLAGAPEVGKTTLLNQLVDCLANLEIPSIYFLTEEPDYRLLERTMKREKLEDMRGLKEKQNILKFRRIFELTPDYGVERLPGILSGIMNRLEKNPIFILDSLHALPVGDKNKRLDTKGQNTHKVILLAQLARDLEIPVIFTSFVPKEKYSKTGIDVFKESGDIEYLIDVGMVLSVKNRDELKKVKPLIKFSVNKNRLRGILSDTHLILDKATCSFSEENARFKEEK